MTRTEFIADLAAVLNERPEKIRPGAKMESFEGWDSTAVLGVIALLEGSVGVEVQPEQVAECKTVQDVINLCQGKLE
jgi:acyl carrier protein